VREGLAPFFGVRCGMIHKCKIILPRKRRRGGIAIRSEEDVVSWRMVTCNFRKEQPFNSREKVGGPVSGGTFQSWDWSPKKGSSNS